MFFYKSSIINSCFKVASQTAKLCDSLILRLCWWPSFKWFHYLSQNIVELTFHVSDRCMHESAIFKNICLFVYIFVHFCLFLLPCFALFWKNHTFAIMPYNMYYFFMDVLIHLSLKESIQDLRMELVKFVEYNS